MALKLPDSSNILFSSVIRGSSYGRGPSTIDIAGCSSGVFGISSFGTTEALGAGSKVTGGSIRV